MAVIVINMGNSTEAIARRISDNIDYQIGQTQVIDNLEQLVKPGEDYVQAIEQAVTRADAVFLVIGDDWLTGDWVNDPDADTAIALSAALNSNTKLIPLLINQTGLPQADNLPADFASLKRRKGMTIREDSFREDIAPLNDFLKNNLTNKRPAPAAAPAVASHPAPAARAVVPAASAGGYSPRPEPGYAPPPPPHTGIPENPYFPPTGRAHVSGQLATPGERLGAYILDAILLGVVIVILAAILIPTPDISDYTYLSSYSEAWSDWQMKFYLFSAAISVAYSMYFLTQQQGQTPGKKALKIRIVKSNGSELTAADAFLRNGLGYFISSIPLGLGFLWMIFTDDREGWHDKIAGTKVIKTE